MKLLYRNKSKVGKRVLIAACIAGVITACNSGRHKPPSSEPWMVATKWADLTLYITRYTPANSPTFASRALGYIGLTMYESVVHGFDRYTSMASQLKGLDRLPVPDKREKYNWMVCLNAAQASILKSIYIQTSEANKLKIDSLETAFYNEFAGTERDKKIINRSVTFGKSIANAVFEWSKTDGGHRGYLRNFDPKLRLPDNPGSWQPAFYSQVAGHYPLHPHWGKNRILLQANEQIPEPPIITYDSSQNSACYREFLKVYKINKELTLEQKEISLWWGDDPGNSFTPPGHSYNLAKIAVKKAKPDLIVAAMTFAKVGLAVADAFVLCWKWKYHFFSMRPSTYINQTIDPGWEPFWPNPPFPAFPSGHAIQAAAAAIVLTNIYGDHFSFTDDSHSREGKDPLKHLEYRSRKFLSFWQAARETAMSRLYGGIHTPADNEKGLEAGSQIGNNVNNLNWIKKASQTLCE